MGLYNKGTASTARPAIKEICRQDRVAFTPGRVEKLEEVAV